MMQWHHIIGMLAIIGSIHILWCGLLFYPFQGQCEKPNIRIEQ